MKKLLLVFSMVLFMAGTMLAQRTITGAISDDSGEPLIGANLLVKGTTTGTVTDFDGKYSIDVPDGSSTLVVSYTGYATQEIELGASNILDVTLSEGVLLSEAVVTALGVERSEKAIGYAVQQVDSETLNRSGATDALQALSGKAAGVNIVSSSGSAAGGSRILVRGQTSLIGNNQPLMVVDGVRISNASNYSEGTTAGTAQSNRLMDINPDDIESINVLKGASATALYGADGAAGVVVITTKSGRKNKNSTGIEVSFTSRVAVDVISRTPDLQNQFAQGWDGLYDAPETGSSTSWGPDVSTLRYNGATDYPYDKNGAIVDQNDPSATGSGVNIYDNVGDYFQTGVSYTNSISFAGGNDKVNFRASYSNHQGEGIVPNNTYDRNTFKVNSSLQLSDKVRITAGLNYTRSDHNRIQQGSNTSGVMLGLLRTPATFDNSNGFGADAVDNPSSYIFADGSQRNYRGGGGYDNPFWTSNLSPRVEKVDRLFGNFKIDYNLHKWLNFGMNIGTDIYNDKRKQEFEINSRTASPGRVFHDDYAFRNLDAYFNVMGNGQLNEDFSLTYLVGANLFTSRLDNNYVEGNSLALPGFREIQNAATVTSTNFLDTRKRFGVYGSVDVGFRNFLYLTLTGRQDYVSDLIAPSKAFDAGDISFFYPSASLSFVFTELMDSDILSYGKIRASYAETGNGAPQAYATSTPFFVPTNLGDGWGDDNQFPFNGTSGFELTNTLGNPNLKPETSKTFEVGADLRFLNGRIGLDVSYYSRKSEDVIINASLAPTTGYTSAFLNTGELEAKGVEVILNVNPVRTPNFSWDVAFNFDHNETTVVSLGPGLDRLQIGGFTGTGIFLVAGNPYGALFGGAYLRQGAIDAGGSAATDDGLNIPSGPIVINDDPTSAEFGFQIPDNTLRAIGDPNPDFTLGINNNFSYKNWNLSFLIDWRHNSDMWNGTAWALSFFGASQLTAETRQEAAASIPGVKLSDGTANDINITRGQNYWTSSVGGFGSVDEQFVQDAGWIRLREVTLSYALPSTVFANSKFIKGLTFVANGRNLWYDTDYEGVDPETSLTGTGNSQGLDYFNMPGTRTVSFSLRADF